MARLVFFDDGCEALRPLNDLRWAGDIRVGPLTNIERLCTYLEGDVGAIWVPDSIADLVKDEHDHPVNALPHGEGPLLLLNARLPMPIEAFAQLKPGVVLLEQASGDPIALLADHDDARAFLEEHIMPRQRIEVNERVLLSRPWHFKSARDRAIEMDLALISEGISPEDDALPEGCMHIGEQRVILDDEALIYPGVTFVAEDGPIVVAARATVRPGATLIGPCFIGTGSTVLEHAVIRSFTSIGPVCKVNGEVSGCVFQGFANKAHDGFLGDSWIGEWVNLGAGTVGSNLLNTYGEVLCRRGPDAPRERTGETFLGAVIGDHVKTAIGTRLMTGCIIHTGCMLAQTAPIGGTIAPFTWMTDAGHRPYRPGKFLDVMRTAMGRRDIEPGEAYVRAVHDLFRLATDTNPNSEESS